MCSRYLIGLLLVAILFYSCSSKGQSEKSDYYSLSEALKKPERVISLDLDGDSLYVFPSLSTMVNLRYLTLSNNYITSIPDEIASLKNLSYLNLKDNKISYVPGALGDIDSLKTVYLMFNPIDSVSSGICKSSSLRSLNLGGVGSVHIPPCLKTHPKLIVRLDWFWKTLRSRAV